MASAGRHATLESPTRMRLGWRGDDEVINIRHRPLGRDVLSPLALALICLVMPACGGSATASGSAGASASSVGRPTSLSQVDASLRAAVRAWERRDPTLAGRPPAAVITAAARDRVLVRRLSLEPVRDISPVVSMLHGGLRRVTLAEVTAARDLRRLAGPPTGRTFHLAQPPPAGDLLADYRRAQRRFGVPWQVLAAVNLVESAFGRVTNRSSAGAKGPMQFMPATWRAYGLGGDIDSAHDAILAAANYLHQSGSPRDTARALFAYNPSQRYVAAVLAYARVMRTDRLGFPMLYSWEASLPSTVAG